MPSSVLLALLPLSHDGHLPSPACELAVTAGHLGGWHADSLPVYQPRRSVRGVACIIVLRAAAKAERPLRRRHAARDHGAWGSYPARPLVTMEITGERNGTPQNKIVKQDSGADGCGDGCGRSQHVFRMVAGAMVVAHGERNRLQGSKATNCGQTS